MIFNTLLLAACFSALTTASPLIAQRSVPPERPDPDNNRRGIAFNNPLYAKYFMTSGSHAKWAYNWDSSSPDTGFEFVPMLWSDRDDHTNGWFGDVRKACGVIEANPTHLLGFNEPDMCANGAGGSCMSVNDAVRAWREWIEPTKDYKSLMYFGSPSVTNSGDADKGLNWLRDFLNQCSGCKIDFLCIHWYSESSATQYFRQHISAARALAGGRPIWITEFSAAGTDDQVKKFMDDVIPWLDDQPDVHRYAYFMAAPGLLVNPQGNGLSEVGRHYATWRKPKSARGEAGEVGSGKVEEKDAEGHASAAGKCWMCKGRGGCYRIPCTRDEGEVFEGETATMEELGAADWFTAAEAAAQAKKCLKCAGRGCYWIPCL